MRPERMMNQVVTYWAPLPGDDGFGGQTLAPPVSFRARWEDKMQTILNAKGEEIVSKATIYLPKYVEVAPDGWIALGKYPPGSPNPSTIVGAAIIRNTGEIPDLRNLTALRTVMV